MTHYDVALIVPIYNVEIYLDECLASIERQTIFERTEVVLVDDGSTDSSGAIASAFASRFANVRLITRRNGGLGAARNTGIAEARAPYLAFLDSDDVLPERSLELRLNAMTDDIDVVVGNMKTFPSKTTWPWSDGVAEGDRVLSGIDEFPELVSNASACNKLFRASTFDGGGFAEGVHFEDAFIIVPLLLRAHRIGIVAEVVYLYRKRAAAGSIMDSLFERPQNYWDHLLLAEQIRELRDQLPLQAAEAADAFLVRSMQGFLVRAREALDDGSLKSYFDRARAVFRGLPVATLLEATRNVHHRIPFVALAIDNFRLFADPWAQARGVEQLSSGAGVKIRPPVPSEVADLLGLSHPRLFVEKVEGGIGARSLLVTGRLELPGVPETGLPETVSVRLSVRGKALSAPAPVTVRRAATSARPTTVLEWNVVIPGSRLVNGRHIPDAHVFVENGQFTIRARPAIGLLRSSRTVRVGSTRVLFGGDVDERIAFLVQRRHRRLNRLAWSLRFLRDDVRALAAAKPLSVQRLIRLMTRPLAIGKPIWLISERGDTAQDNGFALFEWVRANSDAVRARFVLDSSSEGWRRTRDRRGIVARGSVRHRLAMLHARVLISSQDIDAYLLPPQWNRADFRTHLAYRLEQRRVFLQHGVSFNDVAEPLARETTGLDLFVTSVAMEQDYLSKTTRYSGELVQTGMPRYDRLKRVGNRRIVLMPTWRRYLVLPSYSAEGEDPGTFAGSAYERFFTELLQDPGLASVLEKHDVVLSFAPHYEVVRYFGNIVTDSPRIEVVAPAGNEVQDLICSATVFMTDYTSVMFDAAYLGVPVVQLPFDLQDFHERHYGRGWFDNGSGEYWPVAKTVEEAIAVLDRILSSGAIVDASYQSKIDELFARRDDQNSKRVYDAIRALN